MILYYYMMRCIARPIFVFLISVDNPKAKLYKVIRTVTPMLQSMEEEVPRSFTDVKVVILHFKNNQFQIKVQHSNIFLSSNVLAGTFT